MFGKLIVVCLFFFFIKDGTVLKWQCNETYSSRGSPRNRILLTYLEGTSLIYVLIVSSFCLPLTPFLTRSPKDISTIRVWRKYLPGLLVPWIRWQNRDFSYPDGILLGIRDFWVKSGKSRRNRDGWTVWKSHLQSSWKDERQVPLDQVNYTPSHRFFVFYKQQEICIKPRISLGLRIEIGLELALG